MADVGPARDAGAATAAANRREVVVAGTRVRVVDMHAHCSIPEAEALLGMPTGMQAAFPALLLANNRTRLEAMDEQGIDVETLSINPYWYKADRDLAAQVVRIQNEKMAEFCANEPERFVALASVALQHPAEAGDPVPRR